MKTVYISMIADLLHAGHIKIIKEAAKYGEVTVGLLTLKACGELNDIPYLDYEKRREVLENIALVKRILPQDTASYKNNLLEFKPDYVIHGDDWKNNYQKQFRTEVVTLLSQWGGELVEVPYSSDINELRIKEQMMKNGITSAMRQGRLRKLLSADKLVRVLEVHNALSGLIVESINYEDDGKKIEFDAMWSSSLTDSTSKGKPDIETVDTTARIHTVNEIFEVTTKPMIYDADTGGLVEHFEFTVRSLERTGVSAVIIEDKIGLKKNSLLGNDVSQTQDSIESFCHKIRRGKESQITKEFMIIARIESLILEKGMDDAIKRAFAYVDAGADGIMIHSRAKTAQEIIEFLNIFRNKDKTTPVVVVPTSFNQIKAEELKNNGANIVIYANHLLRAAYPAMVNVAREILKNDRSLEVEKQCMSISEILALIPGTT